MPDDVSWQSDKSVATGAAAVGQMLREARESLGLDLSKVAEKTRIRLPYLEAIEAGRVADLPGSIYTVAFLRGYAAHVGLDVERVLQVFRSGDTPVVAAPTHHFPIVARERRVPRTAMLLASAFLLVCAYVTWHALTRDQLTQDARVQPVPQRLLADQKPATPSAPPASSETAPAAKAPSEPSSAPRPAAAPPPANVAAPAPTPPTPTAAPKPPAAAAPTAPAPAAPTPAAPTPAVTATAPPAAPTPMTPAAPSPAPQPAATAATPPAAAPLPILPAPAAPAAGATPAARPPAAAPEAPAAAATPPARPAARPDGRPPGVDVTRGTGTDAPEAQPSAPAPQVATAPPAAPPAVTPEPTRPAATGEGGRRSSWSWGSGDDVRARDADPTQGNRITSRTDLGSRPTTTANDTEPSQQATRPAAPARPAATGRIIAAPPAPQARTVRAEVDSTLELRGPNGEVLATTHLRAGASYAVPEHVGYVLTPVGR